MNNVFIVLGVLIGLAIILFIAVHIYSYGSILFDGLRLRRKLLKNGRVLSLAVAKENIRQNRGIIIVDAPTLGWNVSRIWWAPGMDFTPRPESWSEGFCPPEDPINYRKFIDPSSGSAMLVVGFVFTQRVEDFLKKHFGPGHDKFIFSAGVLHEEAAVAAAK